MNYESGTVYHHKAGIIDKGKRRVKSVANGREIGGKVRGTYQNRESQSHPDPLRINN